MVLEAIHYNWARNNIIKLYYVTRPCSSPVQLALKNESGANKKNKHIRARFKKL